MKLKLLSEDYVWGSHNALSIRAQGGIPIVSDLCLGQGSWGHQLSNHNNAGDTLLAERTSYGSARIWHQTGDSNSCGEDDPKNSIRPVIIGPEAQAIYQAATVKKIEKINGYFVEVIQAGAYPQDVEWNYGELETRYQNGTLPWTGKYFTFNGIDVAEDYGYRPVKSPEFTLNGQQYVRAIVSSFANCLYLGGRRACNGYPCWYRVKDAEWYHEPDGLLIAKKALVAGIPYSVAADYVENTISREIVPSALTARCLAKQRISADQLSPNIADARERDC